MFAPLKIRWATKQGNGNSLYFQNKLENDRKSGCLALIVALGVGSCADTELRECRHLNREVDVDSGAAGASGSHFAPHDITWSVKGVLTSRCIGLKSQVMQPSSARGGESFHNVQSQTARNLSLCLARMDSVSYLYNVGCLCKFQNFTVAKVMIAISRTENWLAEGFHYAFHPVAVRVCLTHNMSFISMPQILYAPEINRHMKFSVPPVSTITFSSTEC